MIYLTVADDYSGVYNSQVLDVCVYFRQWLGIPLRLIAFVPLRTYNSTRAKIKKIIPDASVYLMWPSRLGWKGNLSLIKLLQSRLKNEVIICRGVLATNLAYHFKRRGIVKKIVYDARGATSAEWLEYLFTENRKMIRNVEQLEQTAVVSSDFRMSISESLVAYWNDRFSYNSLNHVIIPTTLGSTFLEPLLTGDARNILRKKYGFMPDDIVVTYSGSSAEWQSFSTMDQVVRSLMDENENIKFLLLTNKPGCLETLKHEYPHRVSIMTSKPESMFEKLNMADYGLLVREESVTNKVAAPTKFAEYLAAGCNVLLKGNVGDYNEFILENKCGRILDHSKEYALQLLTDAERDRNNALAHDYFCKYSNVIETRYRQLVSHIMN